MVNMTSKIIAKIPTWGVFNHTIRKHKVSRLICSLDFFVFFSVFFIRMELVY